jgi:RNA polymerase sigma factor (sigma-70 family)
MEVSALKYHGGLGLHARSPLLRLQSDERLIALIRRGNPGAFEALVSRYETRLLAFCRHLLGSREDAEDVLQEVLAAAFNAILADDRPIKVRPWLYRIARNRSLNHLRRNTTIGVDSMDIHLSDNGASTADKAHSREEFRLLLGDIQDLPETQRTALVLREMDALSYEQIAETMETTVPSVKSLLVRARVSLAEAAEARLLSCDQVRLELGEVAEGLRRRASPPVRRHLRTCERCLTFRVQLRETNKALAALLPFGPLALLKQFAFVHIGHSAGAGGATSAAGSGATASGGVAAGSSAAAGSTAVAGSTAAASSTAVAGSVVATSGASGLVSAGIGAVATKAVAGIAAAALVTAGAVEVGGSSRPHLKQAVVGSPVGGAPIAAPPARPQAAHKAKNAKHPAAAAKQNASTATTNQTTTTSASPATTKPTEPTATTASTASHTVVTTDATHCQQAGSATGGSSVTGQAGAATAGQSQCGTTTTGGTTTTTTTTTTDSTQTSTTPTCASPATGTDTTTTGTTTSPASTTTTDTTPTTTTGSPATTTTDPTATTPSCSGGTSSQ